MFGGVPAVVFAERGRPTKVITASMQQAVSAVTLRASELLVATTAGVIERIPWDAPYINVTSAIVLSRYI